jgi:DNA-binding MarR family transcriptional regulator
MTGIPPDRIAEAARQWTHRWGPSATPAMSAVTSIMRVQQILLGRLNGSLKPFDLTFPRYEALMILYLSRRGSMPLGKIGERLQVHPTSVTSLVDGLERSGFVRRRAHEDDRRATLAEITEAGRIAAEAATEVLNEACFFTAPLRRGSLESVVGLLLPLRAEADGFPAPCAAKRAPAR